MNKQTMRRVSFVVLLLLGVGAVVYLGFTLRVGKIGASVSIQGNRNSFDLFKSYTTWPNSANKKTPTAAEWLHTMVAQAASDSPTTFADVNGDGLADILVHQENVNISAGLDHSYYGVLLNRGDLTFDFVYKCVDTITSIHHFYGDCAAL